MQRITAVWRRYWLLRWTVVNMLGWSLGLGMAALLLRVFGLWGAVFSGTLTGAVVGAAQAHILQQVYTVRRTRWILFSAGGGLVATLPVYLLGFVALLNLNFGLLLMGAAYGGIIGWMQFIALRDARTLRWIAVNLLAGALCAPLSLLSLPLLMSPGVLLYGLLTGFVLRHMAQDDLG